MLLIAAVVTALVTTGCSTSVVGRPVAASTADGDQQLVTGYFEDLNKSGDEGQDAQREFLRRTQHPDFSDQLCELGPLTLRVEPALTTLRPDRDWVPEGAKKRPRGQIYVIAVSVSIQRGGTTVGEQIGSQRVVILDHTAYGFAPCPTG